MLQFNLVIDKVTHVHQRIGPQAYTPFAYNAYFLFVPLGFRSGKGQYLLFNALYHLANSKAIFKPSF